MRCYKHVILLCIFLYFFLLVNTKQTYINTVITDSCKRSKMLKWKNRKNLLTWVPRSSLLVYDKTCQEKESESVYIDNWRPKCVRVFFSVQCTQKIDFLTSPEARLTLPKHQRNDSTLRMLVKAYSCRHKHCW